MRNLLLTRDAAAVYIGMINDSIPIYIGTVSSEPQRVRTKSHKLTTAVHCEKASSIYCMTLEMIREGNGKGLCVCVCRCAECLYRCMRYIRSIL